MVLKCLLFNTHIVSLLLGTSFNCSYKTLYLSTVANTQDSTSQMPKTCYGGLKSSRRICNIALIRNVHRKDVVIVHFLSRSQLSGKFIYKASILVNKQLLSNMMDCETMQAHYTTRISLLTDSYIFCSNYPAILCIIAIASYIAI